VFAAVFPALWVVWAFIFRGGLSYWLVELVLVRANGRKALRLQCAWRALLVWAPVAGLLAASLWLDARHPEMAWLAWGLWWAAILILVADTALAIWLPRRAPHDFLAGTYLVPK
jgi:hypothetical protein